MASDSDSTTRDACLKAKTLSVEVVDYGVFERFVSRITGREFSFVMEEECGNDSDHLFEGIRRVPDFNMMYKETTPPEKIKEWFDSRTSEAQEWVDGGDYAGAYSLLQWLCVRRHVEPGNYLIQVYW